ncbi:MAG: hypothetical protein CMG93_07510 [Marinomonas sp.]|nr:hypothetical protein [Marinomonas sp.]RUM56773.1 MAG: hypothetical protein DSY85_02110 [Marinomonas sp.]
MIHEQNYSHEQIGAQLIFYLGSLMDNSAVFTITQNPIVNDYFLELTCVIRQGIAEHDQHH